MHATVSAGLAESIEFFFMKGVGAPEKRGKAKRRKIQPELILGLGPG
jgi:hypothetical protein